MAKTTRYATPVCDTNKKLIRKDSHQAGLYSNQLVPANMHAVKVMLYSKNLVFVIKELEFYCIARI